MAESNKPADGDLVAYAMSFIRRFFLKQIKSVYYNARETIGGDHKRAIVVHQVEQACVSLRETRNEFEDALQRFKMLVNVNDTLLEHRYHQLNRKYQFCRAKSETVSARIRAIEEVSEALFAEWEKELNEYNSRALKNHSKQQLRLARQNYARLLKSLRTAEAKIHPVLSAFKDQVLYLKHNLNAQAIAALQNEFVVIGIDIAQLIQAMEQTIAEASSFMAMLSDRKALPGPPR
jgi:chromosome segregation ATPase